MELVIKYLRNLLQINDTIVVATSGGPDSMALLNLLCEIKSEKKLNIIVAHVNHNVRTESKEEEILVKDYCYKKNIVFESMIIKETIEKNFEMEARKIRYEFFNILIEKYNAKYLFTAHHGDDLVETILMRLNRGSILKGYKGIATEVKKKNYTIVRPLLWVTKKDILEYVDDNKIPYALDYTNEEDEHTRNRFRHHIIPFLKDENKDVHLKYKEFSEELKMYDDFVENYINDNCKHIYNQDEINIIEFNKEDKLIRTKLIEKMLNNIFDGYLEIINKKHVNSILELIANNKSNTKINLPDGYIALIQYGKFKIIKDDEVRDIDKVLDSNLEFDNHKFIFDIKDDKKSNYIIRLDSNEIKLPLHIRRRKDGDRIQIKNFGNSKKISDILTDEKINYVKRKEIFIVTDNENNILWIPGIKKSKFDKDFNEKYDIIIKYISNKEENYE
ncbi:MAG: tRNA lysidine(34) synthetase TilS [Bacilli bacterium]|nr:tRNA lysidine(34) synthetase TilS [Bacilli bacterium]